MYCSGMAESSFIQIDNVTMDLATQTLFLLTSILPLPPPKKINNTYNKYIIYSQVTKTINK